MSNIPILRPARRHLLSAAGGLMGAGVVPSTAAGKSHELTIGLASYSARKLSVEELIAFCKLAGVTHLTAKDMHLPREAAALTAAREKYAAAGIRLAGGGVIYMKNDEVQVRKDFEYAKAAGLPLIVAAPDPDALDLVERLIKEFGIPVAIHNHGPEDKHYPGPADVMKVIAKRDPRLGVCMDVGHTVRAGADPIACVRQCGRRLFDLHVKDLMDAKSKDSQTEVGRGVVNVAGLMKALRRARFAGHVAIEYEINPDDPRAGIRESLAFVRGVVAGLST